jgi:HEAT repeat protein
MPRLKRNTRFFTCIMLAAGVTVMQAHRCSGQDAIERIKSLIPQLDPAVYSVDHRQQAAWALRMLGKEARPAVPALVEALYDPNDFVRIEAAHTLLVIEPGNSKLALPVLLAALRNANAEVRQEAARRLATLGPRVQGAAASLANALADENAGVRQAAASALGKLGPDDRATAVLLKLLKHSCGETRFCAAMLLGKQGAANKAVVVALAWAFQDTNPVVRAAAGQALLKLGPTRSKAIGILLPYLKKGGESRRVTAMAILQIDPCNKEALYAIVKDLKHANGQCQDKLIWYLGLDIGPKNPEALSVVINVLRDKTSKDRLTAASVFRDLGPRGKAAVPYLIETLGDDDYSLCLTSADALGAIGSEAKAAIPVLTKAIHSRRGFLRIHAAAALLSIESANKDALLVLFKALQSSHAETSIQAATAFLSLGNLPKEAIPGLKRALQSNQFDTTRMLIALALPKYAAVAPNVSVSLLGTAMRDPAASVRAAACESLGKLGAAAAVEITALTAALKDSNPYVRIQAATALGHLSTWAGAAMPDLQKALKKALKDDYSEVRIAATVALAKVTAHVMADNSGINPAKGAEKAVGQRNGEK